MILILILIFIIYKYLPAAFAAGVLINNVYSLLPLFRLYRVRTNTYNVCMTVHNLDMRTTAFEQSELKVKATTLLVTGVLPGDTVFITNKSNNRLLLRTNILEGEEDVEIDLPRGSKAVWIAVAHHGEDSFKVKVRVTPDKYNVCNIRDTSLHSVTPSASSLCSEMLSLAKKLNMD